MSWEQFAHQRWRAALQIHTKLHKLRADQHRFEVPDASFNVLADQIKLLYLSRHQCWLAAEAELNHQALRACTEVISRLQQLHKNLQQRLDAPEILPIPQIWLELEALTEEFSEVDVEVRAQEIRVTTDAIELEGIDLGRFQIVLHWNRFYQTHPYRVIALDPSPSDSREDLFHPHVRDEVLCEGDGQLPIRHALTQGRLLDFFLVVRQVLGTYNPDSAYLTLDKWYGQPCHDCGQVSDREDVLRCHGCEELICSACSYGCSCCCDACCQSCQRLCPHCDNTFCLSCLIDCSTCGAAGCDHCLADGLCPDCHPSEEPTRR
jgi:hypothetical protein